MEISDYCYFRPFSASKGRIQKVESELSYVLGPKDGFLMAYIPSSEGIRTFYVVDPFREYGNDVVFVEEEAFNANKQIINKTHGSYPRFFNLEISFLESYHLNKSKLGRTDNFLCHTKNMLDVIVEDTLNVQPDEYLLVSSNIKLLLPFGLQFCYYLKALRINEENGALDK